MVEPLEGKKKRAFDSALATLSDAIRDTRNISFELMPPVLNDYGLNVAIETFIKRLSERDNMHFNLHVNLAGRLSEKLEVSLYRIVQEIIGNIVKHSGASNATIAITTTNKYIKLSAEDNGIAFSVLQVKRSGKGIGLKSIENRVKLLNGKLKIKSMPGHGTVIKISLPASGELI